MQQGYRAENWHTTEISGQEERGSVLVEEAILKAGNLCTGKKQKYIASHIVLVVN